MKLHIRSRQWLSLSLVLALIGEIPSRASAADMPVLNVFSLAGQSNMAGADSEVADPPGFLQTLADRATRFTMAPLPRMPLHPMFWKCSGDGNSRRTLGISRNRT